MNVEKSKEREAKKLSLKYSGPTFALNVKISISKTCFISEALKFAHTLKAKIQMPRSFTHQSFFNCSNKEAEQMEFLLEAFGVPSYGDFTS